MRPINHPVMIAPYDRILLTLLREPAGGGQRIGVILNMSKLQEIILIIENN